MSPNERPYWVSDAKVENGVYLGFTRGEWPIQAFSADNPSQAASWAATKPGDRVVVGPIEIPADAPFLTGVKVPERVELRPLA